MNVLFKWIAAALLGPVAGQLAHAQPAPQRFPVPGHGSLQLQVPNDWRAASKSLDKPASVLLRIRPAAGDAFPVQVTALWLDPEKRARKTPEQLKQDVEKSAAGPLQRSVEKDLRLEALRGAQALGYYYSLTGREPAPAEKARLLQMFANATHAASATAAARTASRYTSRKP